MFGPSKSSSLDWQNMTFYQCLPVATWYVLCALPSSLLPFLIAVNIFTSRISNHSVQESHQKKKPDLPCQQSSCLLSWPIFWAANPFSVDCGVYDDTPIKEKPAFYEIRATNLPVKAKSPDQFWGKLCSKMSGVEEEGKSFFEKWEETIQKLLGVELRKVPCSPKVIDHHITVKVVGWSLYSCLLAPLQKQTQKSSLFHQRCGSVGW